MKDFWDLKLPASTPGKTVRALRKRLKLTHEDLALLTGIDASNLSDIENDRVELGWDRASRLAAALGVSVTALVMPNGYKCNLRHRLEEISSRAQILVEKKRKTG
ncbi:MAG: helix-turn-helix transcriptional regulator [Deltaproteobacteria bacterium]|nr:helix-turn-helix transcriptional regulator [Deltaproteobacteria bacterium]